MDLLMVKGRRGVGPLPLVLRGLEQGSQAGGHQGPTSTHVLSHDYPQ